MPLNKLLSLLFLCLLLPFAVRSQEVLTKTGARTVDSAYLSLDTLSIVPGTLTLVGLEPADYQVDYLHGGLRILNPEVMGKNISFSYSCFNFDLKNPVQHRSEKLNIKQKGSFFYEPCQKDSGCCAEHSDGGHAAIIGWRWPYTMG